MIAGRYSEDQIWIFGEVIGKLAEEIEVAARAQLAKRLAFSNNAPIYMINRLAFDDSIEVAGPCPSIFGAAGRVVARCERTIERPRPPFGNISAKIDQRTGH